MNQVHFTGQAETLRAQRKTNEDTLKSKSYRNKFDARVKGVFLPAGAEKAPPCLPVKSVGYFI
jgi:hypothetical protein